MKKVLMIVLAMVIAIMPLSGCRKSPDEYSLISVWEDVEGNTQNNTDADDKNESGNNQGEDKQNSNSQNNNQGDSNEQKPVSKNLNELKGKTFTLAVHDNETYNTTSFNSMISAFEAKYGCKIKKVNLTFNKYNQMVTQRQSTGDPYDILYIHGSFFPEGPISNIYEDLGPAIKALGIKNYNKDASSLFDWKGKSYGICSKKSLSPYVMYYNKVMFEEAGLEDPLELYKKNKWTWDKILEMGKEAVAEGGTYFFGDQIQNFNIYGESCIYIDDNGKVVNNLRGANIQLSLNLLRKIYTGNNPIGMPMEEGTSGYTVYFPQGKCYMVTEEATKYADLAPAVKKSMAFNKNVDNLGIVPFPMASENKAKAYPTGWYTAVGAGKGADPRVAVLWAEFEATYKSPVTGVSDLQGEQKKLVDGLLDGKLIPNRHGSYATSKSNTLDLYHEILYYVKHGTDISKILSDYTPLMEACIDATVGEGNYITK